jgi:hypothetical protein
MPLGKTSTRAIAVAGALLALACVGGWTWHGRIEQELAQPFDRHQAGFVGSATCKTCHAERHKTWARTFHRTMTQEATAQSVQGRFDGEPVTYWGATIGGSTTWARTARPSRR